MQIPRGTFRALKRGCDLPALIQELKDTAFCGYCRIAPGSGSITIVFDKGDIRLAEYDTLEGDAALERIVQSGSLTVDAVLHDLSAAQLDLAVEFSPLSVVKPGKRKIMPGQQASPGVSRSHHGTPTDSRNSGPLKEMPNPGSRPVHAGHYHIPAEKPVVKSEISPIKAPDDDATLLSRELDALDSMDIESMAAKFRANCRLMMERLELEHLIDQNTGKDAP
jgi:hypothetical protein